MAEAPPWFLVNVPAALVRAAFALIAAMIGGAPLFLLAAPNGAVSLAAKYMPNSSRPHMKCAGGWRGVHQMKRATRALSRSVSSLLLLMLLA